MSSDDDAFTVSLSYDAEKRILSSLEECPIIGTEGDENSTRVVVRGLSEIYSGDTATTYHECWIIFDIAEIVKNVILTNKIKLVHLSGDEWHCDISANVFNNTIKGKLPVQIMITKVQETDGDKILLQKYYSFNQILFKVAPAIKVAGTC